MIQYISSIVFTGLFFFTAIAGDYNYPVPPKSKELLFYIQRNHNSNTIIYEANYDNNGFLVKKEPVMVSWIRYDDEGQRKELNYIQRVYAYGIKCKPNEVDSTSFILKLVAQEDKKLWVSQSEPYKANVYTYINNRLSCLDHLFIQADNSGIWPIVEYIEMFGTDTITGVTVSEKYKNN
jgi:phosphatidylinositol phosphate synthase